jgi:hypothetical protein
MHRVAHGIVHELTAGDDRETYREVTRRLLAEADPDAPSDSRQWSRYSGLLPHLQPSGVLESTGRVQRLTRSPGRPAAAHAQRAPADASVLGPRALHRLIPTDVSPRHTRCGGG